VDLWAIHLEASSAVIERCEAVLSTDESVRAGRFRFDRDRRRFIVARGALRSILGAYLGQAPACVKLRYGPHGKPTLIPSTGAALRFNLSHAETRALCAVTLGREIGVDVENIRPLSDADDLARRFFSAREVLEYQTLAPGDRLPGFFNCWTRKEAYIKALGDGLSCPLDRFAVSFRPREAARLIWIDGQPNGPLRWSLRSLEVGPAYAGALAVEGPLRRLRRWRWLPESLDARDPAGAPREGPPVRGQGR
jgi:4'-phosphopantetheinyl transferase